MRRSVGQDGTGWLEIDGFHRPSAGHSRPVWMRWCWPPSGAGHQTAAAARTTTTAEMASAARINTLNTVRSLLRRHSRNEYSLSLVQPKVRTHVNTPPFRFPESGKAATNRVHATSTNNPDRVRAASHAGSSRASPRSECMAPLPFCATMEWRSEAAQDHSRLARCFAGATEVLVQQHSALSLRIRHGGTPAPGRTIA
eukprot:scaffold23105_cov79-Phaeocystis_antarctica.AAC.3